MELRGAYLGYLLSIFTLALCKEDPYEFSECFPAANGDKENVFGFSAIKLEEEAVTNFTDYQGKVMLIVNVASF